MEDKQLPPMKVERNTPGNLEGPDRPSENPQYEEYAEVNPREGITGDELMSADINGPDSDYKGWNGVDDIPPSEYGNLLNE